MTDIPRLNGMIRALEKGGVSFSTFAPMEVLTGIALTSSKFDSVVFEGEHSPWDVVALRDAMQFMLDRRKIASSGSVVPSVTPLARVPVNGIEQSQ